MVQKKSNKPVLADDYAGSLVNKKVRVAAGSQDEFAKLFTNKGKDRRTQLRNPLKIRGTFTVVADSHAKSNNFVDQLTHKPDNMRLVTIKAAGKGGVERRAPASLFKLV